ncbi:MAG: AzlC family ABC transporter permease, partial [Eggerthellaceae bacterium]|nr:AzlC family ABC transporter permease [Eggerthellaceae bacterium]
MPTRNRKEGVFASAAPLMVGYVLIGIPCGILSSQIGLNALQVFLFSALFYSGAGQFMIANLWLASTPIASIVASVSLLNTRQTLYSSSLAQYIRGAKKGASFIFAATVTDEGYGLNIRNFQEGNWSLRQATGVNLLLLLTWVLACLLGVLVGNVLDIPMALASFTMTSVFICLLCIQKISLEAVVAALV